MNHEPNHLPRHTPEERAALQADIESNGLQVPVVLDEDGQIIDGRLRAEICKELKIDWKKGAELRAGLTDIEKQALRFRLNLLRRASLPTQEQRREFVDVLLQTFTAFSDSKIAQIAGVSQPTVNRRRNELIQLNRLSRPEATVGLDGKVRHLPERKETRVYVRSRQDFDRTKKAVEILGDNLPLGQRDSRRLQRLANQESRRRRLESLPEVPLPNDINLYHTDCRNLGVVPESVDLVLTDVLWHEENMHEWPEIARLAYGWLKPDGLFASYIGQYYLGKLIHSVESVGFQLKWAMALVFAPGSQCAHELNGVLARWRPIPVFSKSPKKHDFGGMPDVIETANREKAFHEYQQSIAGCRELVRRLSRPGDLVCDPCMGTGTTAVACLETGRRFLGCDRDEYMFNIAKLRLRQPVVPEANELICVPFVGDSLAGAPELDAA